ncbi:MAG TPA: JAB domain-containing protein [Planctomycetaceae bacterium]|nr:JAB domain-containing protein [Planctomycetaceae bacterium]
MAIRRIPKKQNTTTESSEAPNANIQSEMSRSDSHYLEIFRSQLTTADDVDELVRAIISERVAKHLVIFYLDEEHRVLAYTIMTVGPLRMTSISQRALFQTAVETGATAIMLAHHHPQGDAPSIPEDIQSLRRWREAGRILDIPILDLVTVTEDDFVSLKDHLSRSFTEPQW